MNEKGNELIERYLYDVIRRLPEKQKVDIKKELKTLIEDMIIEKGNFWEADEKEIGEILKELGSPAKLAAKYREGEKHLIGEKYYDQYIYILKIVLVCTAVGLVIAAVSLAFNKAVNTQKFSTYLQMNLNSFVQIPITLMNVFAGITLFFAIVEKTEVKLDIKQKDFKPENLPIIPCRKAVIKRRKSIMGMAFTVIVTIWFCFVPNNFGYVLSFGGSGMIDRAKMHFIPVFNIEIWSQIIPFFVIVFSLCFVNQMVRFLAGKYNVAVMISTITTQILCFVLDVIILKEFLIWNTNGVYKVGNASMINEAYKLPVNTFDTLSNLILLIIGFFTIIDIIKTVYCTVKYRN